MQLQAQLDAKIVVVCYLCMHKGHRNFQIKTPADLSRKIIFAIKLFAVGQEKSKVQKKTTNEMQWLDGFRLKIDHILVKTVVFIQ